MRSITISLRVFICLLALQSAPLLLGATYSVIYNFQGGTTDGANPKRAVAIYSGTLYGTTAFGGSNGDGIVFQLTPPGTSWTESVLYNFLGGTDGSEPDGALVITGNGTALYGTTSIGGASMGSGYGTVFKLKNNAGTWTESVLYSFTGGSDGSNPYAGLVLNSGVLYGTTFNGGSSSDGALFSLTPPPPGTTWTEAVLHSFTGPTSDGANPHAPLTASSSTLFYGTTYNGGSTTYCTSGCGTVFKLEQSGGVWTETVIYKFGASSSDGKNPHGGVVIDSSGVLYGTTLAGGANGKGTVFSLTPSGGSWTYAVLHDFAGGASDGAQPRAGVIIDSNGELYGTTVQGGGSGACTNYCGTVYKLTSSGGSFTLLHSFSGATTDGAQPYADLLLSGSTLYGTTYIGGSSTSCTGGCGTVFSYAP